MAKGVVLIPIFKSYHQDQMMPLIGKYKTVGSSSYHPLMLLKVMVY
jgi:hypothetical protein